MLQVLICHAPSDKPVAGELSAFLRRGLPVSVAVEEAEIEPATLLSCVEEWSGSRFVIALLSSESVPGRWVLAEWQRILVEEPRQAGTEVGFLLCGECKFPELLRKGRFFDLPAGRLDAFRKLKRWLFTLERPEREPLFAPGKPESFGGGEDLLGMLWEALADRPGVRFLAEPRAAGKTALALEFARRTESDFECVLWLECEDRAEESLIGDCAAQLGLSPHREPSASLDAIQAVLAERRCLLVLDGLSAPGMLDFLPRGRSSALATTRRLELASSFERVAAAGLEVPPPDLAACSPGERRLLSAMSACEPGGFSLKVAAAVAGFEAEAAAKLAALLESRGLVLEFDRRRGRYLVPAAVRDLAPPASLEEHARGVQRRFSFGDADPFEQFDLAELEHALLWALEQDSTWQLAVALWRRGSAVARRGGRNAEILRLAEAMADASTRRDDAALLEEAVREQLWVLEAWDRFDEARALRSSWMPANAVQLELQF